MQKERRFLSLKFKVEVNFATAKLIVTAKCRLHVEIPTKSERCRSSTTQDAEHFTLVSKDARLTSPSHHYCTQTVIIHDIHSQAIKRLTLHISYASKKIKTTKPQELQDPTQVENYTLLITCLLSYQSISSLLHPNITNLSHHYCTQTVIIHDIHSQAIKRLTLHISYASQKIKTTKPQELQDPTQVENYTLLITCLLSYQFVSSLLHPNITNLSHHYCTQTVIIHDIHSQAIKRLTLHISYASQKIKTTKPQELHDPTQIKNYTLLITCLLSYQSVSSLMHPNSYHPRHTLSSNQTTDPSHFICNWNLLVSKDLAGMCRQKTLAALSPKQETNNALDRGLMHGANFPEHYNIIQKSRKIRVSDGIELVEATYLASHFMDGEITEVGSKCTGRSARTGASIFALARAVALRQHAITKSLNG
ncbi:hypothetical protein WN51_11967 [Melipona quadrifasciata]|uniref:Uncharacterized protein n=1 Tax=Melipona quadrifasciata TaxID=166423 RepID=A0A0M9A330_9HYME|nr:hypothetical protein WN51_11967 [Melipona quadrifasciata]